MPSSVVPSMKGVWRSPWSKWKQEHWRVKLEKALEEYTPQHTRWAMPEVYALQSPHSDIWSPRAHAKMSTHPSWSLLSSSGKCKVSLIMDIPTVPHHTIPAHSISPWINRKMHTVTQMPNITRSPAFCLFAHRNAHRVSAHVVTGGH